MQRRWKLLVGVVALTTAVAGSALAAAAIGRPGPGTEGVRASQVGAAAACPPANAKPGQTTEIATAKLIIEYNATDQDIGVHGAFDDHGWKGLCVFDPDGRLVLQVSPQSQLRDLTMAGIFFESREPPASEFSFADLHASVPGGQYTVRARVLRRHDPDRERHVHARRSRGARDRPTPELAADPQRREEGARAARRTWWSAGMDVTQTVSGEPVDITGYEVIVTNEGAADPYGFSQPIYDVHVPPSLNSLRVPVEFLEPAPSTSWRCWRSRRAATRPSRWGSSRRLSSEASRGGRSRGGGHPRPRDPARQRKRRKHARRSSTCRSARPRPPTEGVERHRYWVMSGRIQEREEFPMRRSLIAVVGSTALFLTACSSDGGGGRLHHRRRRPRRSRSGPRSTRSMSPQRWPETSSGCASRTPADSRTSSRSCGSKRGRPRLT